MTAMKIACGLNGKLPFDKLLSTEYLRDKISFKVRRL